MECHFIGSVNTFSVSASSSSLSYSHSYTTWACLAHDEISSQTIDRSSFLQIVVSSKVKQVLRSSSAAMYSSVVVSGSICWMSSSRLVAHASFSSKPANGSSSIQSCGKASVFFWSNLWCYLFPCLHDPSYGREDVHWLQVHWDQLHWFEPMHVSPEFGNNGLKSSWLYQHLRVVVVMLYLLAKNDPNVG